MLPFYLGIVFFFLTPLIQSLVFSFSNVKVNLSNYDTSFVGFENYKYVFKFDVDFSTNIVESLLQLLWQVPTIIVASLFVALLIKPNFVGRGLVRGIFFLPVIVTSGVVVDILNGDAAASTILSGGGGESGALQSLLVAAGLNQNMVDFFTLISNNLSNILWKIGVQIVIFLAGLQSIPSTLYEASAVEGATAWEDFWKITIPMMTPIILINFVYTIVDSFTDVDNKVMQQVMTNTNLMRLGYASAMVWSYFCVIAVVLAITFFIAGRSAKSDGRVKV